jgi:predicted nucleic acid-binding protein
MKLEFWKKLRRMKRVIVDTNIIFSALLRFPNSHANLIFEEDYEFYTPHFVIVELFKHKERIIQRSQMSEEDILEILYRLLKHIQLINDDNISDISWKKAYQLCRGIDIKDAPFVALSMELNALLWTSDKKLKNHLTTQSFSDFL